MATAHSFDSLVRFRLKDAPSKSAATCTLTLENDSDPLFGEEPAFRFTFAVDLDDEVLDEKKAVRWLETRLETCQVEPVDVDETHHLGPQTMEKISYTVKNMAELWVKAHDNQDSVFSPSSSTTTLNDISSDEDGSPHLRRRESYLSEIAGTSSTPGRFSLTLLPSGPSTPTAAGGHWVDSDQRNTLVDDSFIEQLSSVKWEQVWASAEHKSYDTHILPTPITPPESALILPPPPIPAHPVRAPSLISTEDRDPPAPPAVEDAPVRVKLEEWTPPVEEAPVYRWYQVYRSKKRLSNVKPTIAVLADETVVVLPSPPTDTEKYLYERTRRLPLYLGGAFSFCSVSTGMWLFVTASRYYVWIAPFIAYIQIYLCISYFVGFCGRDFDMEGHKKIVEDFPVKADEKCELIDVYLPCCKEPLEVLENTYRYVSRIDYPNFKVWVLDDGGMESVKRLATAYGFNYITRDNKPHLKKAGNLRYAFTRTDGDFFMIFDADFCPRADILKEMLPRMRHDPKIAIVQTPQFFRCRPEQTWVEQGASATQEYFYRVVQVNRDRFGASICVGSNALYRREALAPVGGTAEIGHSEDVHTGFYALTRGWTLKYLPLALACGVSPDTPAACFSQQMRWCSGSSYLLTNPDFWKSSLTKVQKICYLSGMLYYSGSALSIFVIALPGLLLVWIDPGLVFWYNFLFAVPSLLYTSCLVRVWSRANYNFNVTYLITLQQYAYLMALKDRVFRTTAAWVPSGDNNAHVPGEKKKKPNNKYRNMRILCGCWVWGTASAMLVGCGYRIWQGWHWYNFFPLILLQALQLLQTHKFILYS